MVFSSFSFRFLRAYWRTLDEQQGHDQRSTEPKEDVAKDQSLFKDGEVEDK